MNESSGVSVLFALTPLFAVGGGALWLMLAEAFGRPGKTDDPFAIGDVGAGRSSELAIGATAVLFAGAVLSIAVWVVGPDAIDQSAIRPFLEIDRFALFLFFVLCLGGALTTLLAAGYLTEHRLDRGEFYPLLLLSTAGAMALSAAADFLSVFIALETLSLGVYCMIGLRRGSPRATEAALKYFLLGSFAAALLLFGVALLYGATGRTDFSGIGEALSDLGRDGSTVPVGLVVASLTLLLSGLAFKVSAVPFHMWTPDAYEGAPTPATTYMAVAVKSAAFAVLLRVLVVNFGSEDLTSWGAGWPPVVALLAVLTMTIPNLIAGRQDSVKRMLAYSSIAHAGYVLVGVAAANAEGRAQASILFYLLAYTVSTAGAFGALILAGSRGAETVSYEDLAGLGRRHPAVALALSVFLLSLAGAPPTVGFFGKLYVFSAGIDAELYTLVVIALLNSLLAAYYYLRVLVYMYMREPAPGAPMAKPMRSPEVAVALLVAAVFVVGLGLLPGLSLEVAAAATLSKP